MTPMNDRQKLVLAVIEIAEHDMSKWGTGGLGVALLYAHYAGLWVTASQLAKATALSVAQTRRRLDQLVDDGLVCRRTDDSGRHLYTPHPDEAEASMREIESRVALPLQSATPLETQTQH